jgi:hypothetical protein
MVLVALFLPSTSAGASAKSRLRSKVSISTLKRVDTLGAFLLLLASVTLVFALEQGGSQYPWDNAAIIATLVISGLSWIGFVTWEVWLERPGHVQEPIFPMRLLKNRVVTGMML